MEIVRGKKKQTFNDPRYEKIGVLDPDSGSPSLVIVHDANGGALHSPVFVGPRERPPVLAGEGDPAEADDVEATGFLFCQNARLTRNTTAGWPHVRAIRVLAGKGLTVRSGHSYIVHAGNETAELGTVPLAPDGSFYVEVPANTPLALQAVDAEGRSELNEMSWIYVKPGEQRSCVGCHADRQGAPVQGSPVPLALSSPPLKLLGRLWHARFDPASDRSVGGFRPARHPRRRDGVGKPDRSCRASEANGRGCFR